MQQQPQHKAARHMRRMKVRVVPSEVLPCMRESHSSQPVGTLLAVRLSLLTRHHRVSLSQISTAQEIQWATEDVRLLQSTADSPSDLESAKLARMTVSLADYIWAAGSVADQHAIPARPVRAAEGQAVVALPYRFATTTALGLLLLRSRTCANVPPPHTLLTSANVVFILIFLARPERPIIALSCQVVPTGND